MCLIWRNEHACAHGCRRLKCDGNEGSIHCDQLPAVENFVAAARALQAARGLDDSEVRFFVGADQPESYQKVRNHCLPVSRSLILFVAMVAGV